MKAEKKTSRSIHREAYVRAFRPWQVHTFDMMEMERLDLGKNVKNIYNFFGWKTNGCFQKYGKTPKSSILIGFSIVNHPFWGTTIFGNTQMIVKIKYSTTIKLTLLEVLRMN